MRNLSRHAGPNRMMFLLLIPCLLLSALRAKAEETALPEGKRPGVTLQVEMYEGENETYIEASAENSGSILYDKEIRDKPRTRRTKRNV